MMLRQYQRDAVDSINKFFRSYKDQNPLIVAPTGSGKSVMIAKYIEECLTAWPETRILCLAHVKELIEQNYNAIKRCAPWLDAGIYSASLKRRNIFNAVIVGQIQSVFSRAEKLGFIDLCIIDECHLINPKNMGRYRRLIEGLKERNPNLKLIGFTATPYRLGHGYIHKGDESLLNGIAHEISIEWMIKEGYLVRPSAKAGQCHADLSGVHIRAGEYIESEAAEAFEKITLPAVRDILSRTQSRKCGLVFCTGVQHAQHVAAAFKACGEYSVEVVTGTTHKTERENLVRNVKAGKLRWLVNVDVFTTGFDAANIDCIVFLRATQSTGLYVQMIGRGLRLIDPEIANMPSAAERLLAISTSSKPDCLVLDYGENVERHGPLNYLCIREPGERRQTDQVRAKACPQCEELVPANAQECPHCQYVFPVAERSPTHGTEAAEVDLLAQSEPHWVKVYDVKYSKHAPLGKIASLRVDYDIGQLLPISEWICFDHEGYAQAKAKTWAKQRGCPWMSVERALEHKWPDPSEIKIKRDDSRFWRIVEYKWEVEKVWDKK